MVKNDRISITHVLVSMFFWLRDARVYSPPPPVTPRVPHSRRIVQHEIIAFGKHFEVALMQPNHSGAVADGQDRCLR